MFKITLDLNSIYLFFSIIGMLSVVVFYCWKIISRVEDCIEKIGTHSVDIQILMRGFLIYSSISESNEEINKFRHELSEYLINRTGGKK